MRNTLEDLGGGVQGLGDGIKRIVLNLKPMQNVNKSLSKPSQTLVAHEKRENRLRLR